MFEAVRLEIEPQVHLPWSGMATSGRMSRNMGEGSLRWITSSNPSFNRFFRRFEVHERHPKQTL